MSTKRAKNSRTSLQIWLLWISASILLHLLYILVQKSTPPRPSEAVRPPVKVKIVTLKKKLQEKAESTPATPRSQPKPAPPDEPEKQKKTQVPTDAPNRVKYQDLFPGPTWSSGTVIVGGEGTNSSDTVRASSTTKELTNHLEGQLDIPLVFRETNEHSKAVAKFRRKKGAWHFEYIDGEPVLRAVLYEAFRHQANLAFIEALATELETHEIIMTLEQTTKPSVDGWKHFNDDITYQKNRINYRRTILTGYDGSSGIALPDKEAERAKARDRGALTRLRQSPAFFSPIRNRKIVTIKEQPKT